MVAALVNPRGKEGCAPKRTEPVHQLEVLAVHFNQLVGAHQHQQRPPPHPQEHKLLVVHCVQH